MLQVDAQVVRALAAGNESETWALASYQGRSARLSLASGSVTWSGDGAVPASCDLRAVGVRESLVPKSKTDLLAPYGQEVAWFRDVFVRDRRYTIPLGVFRITDASGGDEQFVDTVLRGNRGEPGVLLSEDGLLELTAETPPLEPGFFDSSAFPELEPGFFGFRKGRADVVLPGRMLGWSVDVSGADRMRALQRAEQLDLLSPVPGNSMWDEIRRLSLYPVQQSLPDRGVPASMVYENREQAITALAKLADAVPVSTRQGVLTLRRVDRWLTADPAAPEFDLSGTITWSDAMTDDFVNRVVAKSDDDQFVGVAQISDDSNPLSIGRAKPVTYVHSSPLYTSNEAASAGAQTILDRLLNRSRKVTVTCMPDALLLDLGDVGWMRDPVQGREVFGEVSGMRVQVDPTAPVEVEMIVAETR